MAFSKNQIFLIVCAGALLLSAAALLYPGASAQAQCGSQASSCKNCHEVQGKDPVNADGTNWHKSHAFGDFCYICHAGNSQSMDETAAHSGMVPPLSDIQAACQTCHPDDMGELAQVYATTLGVTVGEGGAPEQPAGSNPGETGESSGESAEQETAVQDNAPMEGSTSLVTGADDVVDYQQRYDEMVSGVRSVNVGNVIAATLIVALVLGGGAFAIYNERKRGDLPIFRKKAETPALTVEELPAIEGVPAEVAALLPQIARLNPKGLHALQRLLENPDAASELFNSLSRLDPELVTRVRNLDRSTRELLLAMSGD